MPKYAVIIEQQADTFGAYVPDLPGCAATGATLDDVKARIREALKMHLAVLKKTGEHVPAPNTTVEYVDVVVSLGNR